MTSVRRFGLILLLGAAPLTPLPTLAQTAPVAKAFILNEYEVRDAAALKEIVGQARASLKDYKGELVLREKVDSLFGGTPSSLSVISFPTIAEARAWLASPAFSTFKAARDKAASVRSYLVEALD